MAGAVDHKQRNRSFWLYFLYLRNVQRRPGNPKRAYCGDRGWALNLRIKPKRRQRRKKSEPLTVGATHNPV